MKILSSTLKNAETQIEGCVKTFVKSVNRQYDQDFEKFSLEIEELLQKANTLPEKTNPSLEILIQSVNDLAEDYGTVIVRKLRQTSKVEVGSAKPASTASEISQGGKQEKKEGFKYYYDDNGNPYRVGDTLIGNNTYTLNGYTFTTDSEGRIISAEGTLKLGKRDPIADSMESIGQGFELEDDDRGHIIAAMFDSPDGLENLVPQNLKLNRGTYKAFELSLMKEMKDHRDVKVYISIVYPDGETRRPSGIYYGASIDGKVITKFFKNEG